MVVARPRRCAALNTGVELVEDVVAVGGHELTIVHPRQPDELIDEEAFEREEFLPYWAELWPSGVALARELARRRLGGIRVLELGCGLAVPSIAAALAGARVLATDWSPDGVRFARLNAERNGARLETAVSSWAAPEAELEGAPWPLVVAADVLYERRDVELLLDLLPRLVDERGKVLLADPGRPPAQRFFEAAAESWSIESRTVSDSPRVTLYTLKLPG